MSLPRRRRMVGSPVVERPPPADPALIAQAKSQPGGWLYDIDRSYPADQPVPPGAVRGAWKIDAGGNVTTEFTPNTRYRAVAQCDRKLKPYVHAAARSNRDQWIAEIDPRGEASFPEIPPELIRGWWYVDEQGVITPDFRPNSLWKPEEGRDEAN